MNSRRRESDSGVLRRMVHHTPSRCFFAFSVSCKCCILHSQLTTRLILVQQDATVHSTTANVQSVLVLCALVGLTHQIVFLSFNNLSWNLGCHLRDKIPTHRRFYRNTRRRNAKCRRICRLYAVQPTPLQHFKLVFRPSYPSHRACRHWREGTRIRLLRVDNWTQ